MKKLFLLLLTISTTYSSHAINIKDLLYSITGRKQEPVEQVRPFAPQVAIINIEDPIDNKEITRKLIDVTINQDIFGVILVIDSFGGECSKFGVLHDLIKKLSLSKPTVCLASKAASSGYLIASATNYIIAHSASSVGAIGISWTWEYTNNTSYEFMGGGKHKETYHLPPSQLSEENKLYLQDRLNKDYQIFLRLIAANRPDHLSLDNQKDWAEAQMFTGAEAVQVGLVDEIGTFFEAESKVKELIHKQHPNLAFESVTYV